MNLLVDLKGYEGQNSSCPDFKKNKQYIGIDVDEQQIQSVKVDDLDTYQLFTTTPTDLYKFVYLEASGTCEVIINGTTESLLKPVVINDTTKNGILIKTSEMETFAIRNISGGTIDIYFVANK